MARHENAAKRLAAGALATDFLGFCFMVVGVFGPAWFVVTNKDGKWRLHEGIWFARYCKDGECETSTREEVLEKVDGQFSSALEEPHWKEFKVLSILAIVGSFIAVVTTIIVLVKKSKKFHTHILIISGVSALSSCMFLLVPVLKTSYVDSSATIADAWTKIVAYVGVFFHFIATVIQVFAVYQSCQNYCAVKKHQRQHHRRFNMVVRYLSSQHGDCNDTVSVTSGLQPMLATTGEVALPNTVTSNSSINPELRRPPPYSVATELPMYTEITSRYLNN